MPVYVLSMQIVCNVSQLACGMDNLNVHVSYGYCLIVGIMNYVSHIHNCFSSFLYFFFLTLFSVHLKVCTQASCVYTVYSNIVKY